MPQNWSACLSGIIRSEVEAVQEITAEDDVSNKSFLKYRLKALMNVNLEQSMNGKMVGTKDPVTIVDIKTIENDWLRLVDNTFIHYSSRGTQRKSIKKNRSMKRR